MNQDGAFDVIIVGTGLTESISAAALAKAGYKIAHVDPNPYYGASEASLTVDEFLEWGNKESAATGFQCLTSTPFPQSRQYAISLCPSVIPSTGPLIFSLVGSGVARYGGFRLVESVSVYSKEGVVHPVPGNKEDVFKNKAISLVDKRRLMRFLMFASSTDDFESAKELQGNADKPFVEFLRETFSLKDEMVVAIAYALAYCFSETDTTMSALVRIRRYLRSTGRYGASPFLVGQYGSTGEIAQGFCRTAAVGGTAYILGRPITSIIRNTEEIGPTYTLQLDDFPEPLTSNVVISSRENVVSQDLLNSAIQLSSQGTSTSVRVARAVIIVDQPVQFVRAIGDAEAEETGEELPPAGPKPVDLGILVFPPSTLPSGLPDSAVNVLICGEGTMSTPTGKWILYFSAPIRSAGERSPEDILKPYVQATMGIGGSEVSPLLSAYYWDNQVGSEAPLVDTPDATYVVSPTLSHALAIPESPDVAARDAEQVFRKTVEVLKRWKPVDSDEELEMWPPVIDPEEEDDLGNSF